MKIQLKNGHWLEAKPIDGELFEATLASGKTKIYGAAQIRAVDEDHQQDEVIDTNKEEPMTQLYHYLHDALFDVVDSTGNVSKKMQIVRIVSTDVSDAPVANGLSMKGRYEESKRTRKISGNVFAVNTGTWDFYLLRETLVKAGRKFRLMIVANSDVAEWTHESLLRRINESTFCYANASFTFFLKVEGEVDFGLDSMGITIDMAKKSAKRLQEIFRMEEMYLMLRGPEQMAWWDIHVVNKDQVTGDPMFFDGKSYMRQSFAIRCARNIAHQRRQRTVIRRIKRGEMVHMTARIMTPDWLGKGDFIIVPDDQINHDVVLYADNCKTELKTDGYIFVSMWEHEMVHMAVWDDQSTINFRNGLTATHQRGDIIRMFTTMEDHLKSGELPEWLILGETERRDDGSPNMERLSETYHHSWIRWQAHNLSIAAAQNLVYMATNGVLKRMDRAPKINGFYKKMWIPMTNAALLSVNTWESATRLGGFTFPNQKKDVCFYDKRAGFIISGRRFVETYNLHGGWDLDDTLKVIIVKVHCSDPEILKQHLGKTVPMNVPYNAKAEDARLMVILVRSPNGPGEWSIEECDISTLPISDSLRRDDITVIDIARMPLPQDVLAAKSTFNTLPTSTLYSGVNMTRADAQDMIEAQLLNPGIGRYCNAMMIWSAGNSGFPANMLARMEDFIDTSQQGFDVASFNAMAVEHERILEQAAATGKSVDHSLLMTRLGDPKMRAMFRTHKGRGTDTQQLYMETYGKIETLLRNNSFQMRMKDPTVIAVRKMQFSNDLLSWAVNFYGKYSKKMAVVDALFDADKEKHSFRKMQVQAAHKLAMEEIVSEMVEVLTGIEDDDHILALWHFIVTPVENDRYAKYGRSDRIVFQPNKLGEMSVMDVLLSALVNVGLAIKPR